MTGGRTEVGASGMRCAAITLSVAGGLVLGGCDTWFGAVKEPLPGERQSVMLHQSEINPDPALGAHQILLPRPVTNPDWPQAGGYANHAMHHLWIEEAPGPAWRFRIGSAADADRPRLPPPIVAGGRLFAMDAEHRVNALEATTGKRLWQARLAPRGDEDLITGGLGYEAGRVFAASGFAEVIALDAATGEELWRRRVDAPVHAPPAVRDGRLFVISVTNTLHTLDAETGNELWIYRGIGEMAAIIGGANPAVDGEVVVAPFSSGELVALRVDNGRVLWSDSLASTRRTDELAAISHIRAAPVIDRGRVYAVSYSGVMVAIDLRSGRRIWDQSIGGLQRPWIAGDYLFLVTLDGELVSLSRDQGRVFWLTPLPAFEDPERRRRPILWSGPVLAGDRLVVAGSNREVLTLSPYTGEPLGRIALSARVTVPPVVAAGSLYVLSDDAELHAYR